MTKENIYTSKANQKEMAKWIEDAGQFLVDNKDKLVECYSGMREMDINVHVSIDSLPTVTVNHEHLVADWNHRRKYLTDDSKEGE